MQIATPNGEVVETTLEKWQIIYCFYMSMHAGIGESKPVQRMLELQPDDSFFTSAVGRTFKFAFDKGYDTCLHELLD